MAQIGYLGDILFQVNNRTVQTLDNMVWSGSARYAEHQRHLSDALTEFTGLDPDKMSFDILLSKDLGVDVRTELVKIWTYNRSAEALRLVIGSHAYGKFRWVIRDHQIKTKHFDSIGNIQTAEVSINLLEYLRR